MAVLVEGRISGVIIVTAGRVLVANREGFMVIIVQVIRVVIVRAIGIVAPTGRGLGAFGARFAGDTLGRAFLVATTAPAAATTTPLALALLTGF